MRDPNSVYQFVHITGIYNSERKLTEHEYIGLKNVPI